MKTKYSINFKAPKTKFCFTLHYNGRNSYLFLTGTETHKFQAKLFEVNPIPLCLGNILNDVSIDNIKKRLDLWICL